MKNLFKIIVLIFLILISPLTAQNNPVDYVDPFIGTVGWGYVFPGAVVPWGMVSVSPHNFSNPAGYKHGEKYFYGFGHVHLSGVGCNELGSVILTASAGDIKTEPEGYKVTYSNEKAEAGYYSILLDESKVQAEVTATERCGITRFSPSEDGKLNILLDAGRSLSLTGGGQVIIRSNNTVEGHNISGAFCGEINREKIYFFAEFSRPSSDQGLWLGDSLIPGDQIEIQDSSIGCWFTFDVKKSEPLSVKIGISYVSTENAQENLKQEIPLWDFDLVRSNAEKSWKQNLSRIAVEGGSKDELTKFYTAFYHMLIHPNVISDVNGEYPLMGRNGIGKYKDRRRYTVFSLWDTYRTLHPFLTLVFPERQSEIIKTMIDMYSESGFLPKWELAANETYMMVGDPAAPVIADSYIKGISDFDVEKAFEAILKPAVLKPGETAPPIRAGYHELLEYGYIPFEQDWSKEWWVWGPVSTTLEYNLSDWAISQMAAKLGKTAISEEFLRRSLLYKNLFDSTSKFIRPKFKNGQWMEPFDPLAIEGSGDWQWSGGPGYVEGNAWNYTWFVPHDIPGLIKVFGGEKQFTDKLYESFINKQFTITNEPDIAYPYLFNYIKGEEYRTRDLVKKIIRNDFGTGPDGLPGNDDCGAISGWLVFSMLGFYPDCPASEYYQLGMPSFEKATINLNEKYYPGKTLIIEKTGSSESGKIIFNNNINLGRKINHNNIVKGGILKFLDD
ncbi:MAG: GH92 family glycosyl hydrolase [Ignavibacteriaceae bacterium]